MVERARGFRRAPMAAFAHVRNINDDALRPRLLKRILKEDVLAVKRPLGNSAQLSKVISDVKTYGLLTESTGNGTADQKLLSDWKTSVDSWTECVLQLVSNDMVCKDSLIFPFSYFSDVIF